MKIVSPSVLSLDFSEMKTQLKRVEVAGAKWLHFDVMDGHFVPNISFGPGILKQVDHVSDLLMDVHLMISDPVQYFDAFIDAGADAITIHAECFDDVMDGIAAVKDLKKRGIKAGITLKPGTDISLIVPYLKHVDIVLVMSVEPGFGGQAFMPEMLDRIKEVDAFRQSNNYEYLISVDGGINDETGIRARSAGADILVAGSYVFSDDIEKAVISLL
ncbi:ribulose-phosphate 3-epimerase [Erysipelothrix aquatica]|uniref:ribulose-phosphate 3-epimerase n=1 Tax=Erysipelothrix aquatica TaxID=2683714 RepID=UPI00135B2908|nr:ribulose-phosphate 3-epimerase [Erysipelothrix aquatica]